MGATRHTAGELHTGDEARDGTAHPADGGDGYAFRSRAPRISQGPLLDLEPLARWCGAVLERGLDGGALPAAQTPPPLPAHLRTPLARYGFDAFDETVIALTLASDLDPVLALAMSAVTGAPGPRNPTLSAIADLVGALGPDRARLAARLCDGGPLSQVGLIHIVPPADCPVVGDPPRGPSMLATSVSSTALLRWTFGVTRLEPALFPLVRDDLIAPANPPDAQAAATLILRLTDTAPSCTSLVGGRSADALAVALYAVARCGRPALVVDASTLLAPASTARVAAEALLREAIVIVTGDASPVPPGRWEALATSVVVGAHPILGDDGGRNVASIVVREGARASMGAHLVDVLRSNGMFVAQAEEERMGRWEHLQPQDVGTLASTLTARAGGRASGMPHGEVTSEDVTSVSVGIVGRDLSRLATPLQASRDWTHLVLPPGLRQELAELVGEAAGRAFVLDELGFAEQPGQPRGVTAVFAGPSGTGKTLAARLVAGELGLPLYRVDLARTVSKYIGETERNLDAVFAAAEQSDAVLLFDEAESLFGKRSEVQDARDRYANLEISFLLQRMESYEGVAILATNLLGHLDDAFARRLSFCLHFPFPDKAQRSLIWRAVWPARIDLSEDLDFDEIARLHPLSGGHIRNVAVAAAHLARTGDGTVDQRCLRRAIDREYAKLGLVPETVPEVVS